MTKLTNQHWVSLGDINQTKRVFIFRTNNQLLISDNGIVEKGSWEYLGNQSLLLDTKTESYLLKHGFFDESVIALKLDSTNSYAFFVNETKYQKELNNINDVLIFLEKKYLNNKGPIFWKNHSLNGVTYEIIREEKRYSIMLGSHTVYVLNFDNGMTDEIFKGSSIGKYYFFKDGAMVYCDNFDDAANKLFKERNKQNNR